MQKIYAVEDDDNLREIVVYALTSAGFSVVGFAEGIDFFRQLNDELPMFVILDIMLPGVDDGLGILKKLKLSARTKHIPVILLTAKSSEYDKVIGLDLGADDYITKPFSVLELISRVKAVLRRTTDREADRMVIDCVTIDRTRRSVWVCGEPVLLTYKEFELLYYLAINEGIVLSREKLMDQVWGFDFEGASRTVDMHIKSLRQKLGLAGDLIKTIRSVGYKLDSLRNGRLGYEKTDL